MTPARTCVCGASADLRIFERVLNFLYVLQRFGNKFRFVPIPVLKIDGMTLLGDFEESTCPRLAMYRTVKQSLSFGTKPCHAKVDFEEPRG